MANLLFLTHRLPFPPNKGDKVRSYHLLAHLAEHHRVHLGTFVDDPDDEQHVPAVRALCAELHVARLHPRRARLASLGGLARGEPLSLAYYRDAGLARWTRQWLRGGTIDAVLVFSSSMAQYAEAGSGPVLVDFVDVDSAKFSEMARHQSWPMSWVYRREGRELLAYERDVAARAEQSFFCTDKETELFRSLAPESADRVQAMGNGVDARYFAPDRERTSPFAPDETALVFTGAMDYWPNIDAVTWFVAEMLPALLKRRPRLRLHIVGRSPSPAVKALAGPAVNVTGTVPDVRPYLQHAAVVVAPLRLARGIQNKVLEAMAMERAVVAAASCVEAIDATPGEHLLGAVDPADYIRAIEALLQDPLLAGRIGRAARQQVLSHYDWDSRLAGLAQRIRPRSTAHTA